MPFARSVRIAIPLLLAATASACEHLVSPIQIQPVAQAEPIDGVEGYNLASIKLDRIGVKLKRGTKIGASYFVYSVCGGYGGGDIHWNSGRLLRRDVEFQDVFHEVLTDANYRVVGDPDKMFDRGRERSEFLVGAQITDIKVNLCDRVSVWRWQPRNVQSGEASVVVEWQLYSNLEKRVVYRTTTEGYTKMDQAVASGLTVLIQNAFGAAASNLAADRQFLAALRHEAPARTAGIRPVDQDRIEIAGSAAFVGPIRGRMTDVLAAAVTIEIGPDGHGSGFFITDEGHLLTNYHVVGDAERVRVRLRGGTTLIGRVLRRHRSRDVALVKVDAGGTAPLPIRIAPASVGEEVYAIGTPLDRSLSSTVTKGIVSAIRKTERDNLVYIQADVDIQGGNSGGPLVDSSGNLIGISVSGIGHGGMSAGLNFFIPIHDAMSKLRLTRTETAFETR